MYNIKRFQTTDDYESFKNSTDWLEPNLCSIEETREVKYQNITPPAVGDVAYYDGTPVIKYISIDEWDTSLGNPIGVVVIPGKILPDQRARIVSLFSVDINGNKSTNLAAPTMSIDPYGNIELDAIKYGAVPITDNTTSESNSYSSVYGTLPTDRTNNGILSVVDPYAYYGSTGAGRYAPSPYKGNNYTLNKDYCKIITNESGYIINNALSDFNGLSNTENCNRSPFEAAWLYKDGYSNKQWYLPSAGEIGFLGVRLNQINEIVKQLGGVSMIYNYTRFWTSTYHNKGKVYSLDVSSSAPSITPSSTNYSNSVRPFALL